MKKVISVIITAAVLFLTSISAFAESAGFAAESELAVPARTPYSQKYVEILWNTPEAETSGVPITYGEFVLLPTLNTVKKLSEKDGTESGIVSFDEKVSVDHHGAVIGSTLVQPTRSSIYAVDLESMSVKCSRQFGEICTDAAMLDNLVYFGIRSNEGYKFICADLNKELDTVWEYSSKEPLTSPALYNDFVVFGTGENLIAHKSAEKDFVQNPVGAEITNVFGGKYAIFMTGTDGNLYKLRLQDDGKTEEDTLSSCELGGELTAPAEYDNRVYVGSTEGFFVLDGLNMEILKSYPEMKNASAPVISYGNGQRAYTAAPHADPNGERWYLYGILDNEDGQTVEEIIKIIDFTGGKTAVSPNGTMYFRDAKGQLWAIAVSELNIFVIVLKIVLMIGIIVMIMIIIRAWAKKRNANKPPQY